MQNTMRAEITISNGIITEINESSSDAKIIIHGHVYEFENAHIFPGFVDSHGHVAALGEKLNGLAFDNIGSQEECIEKALKHKEFRDGWLVGRGWNNHLWKDTALPDKKNLDDAFPGQPVYFARVDGHSAWVNSKALEIAGIDENTPDPKGGKIKRWQNGEPTGLLIDNAMNLVRDLIPDYSGVQLRNNIRTAMDELVSKGITEVHNLDVPPAYAALYKQLDTDGKLKLRIQSYFQAQDDEYLAYNLKPYSGDMLNFRGIKFYADGALGSRGAALLNPYEGRASKGLFLTDETTLYKKAAAGIEAGFDIATHAIGDAAVRTAINAYEKLRHDFGDEIGLRIEHLQLIDDLDLTRIADNAITAAVQPIHCTSDTEMAEKMLGGRCSYAYKWKSLFDAGILVCGGSDFPIESHDPLSGIDAFVNRIPPGKSKAWFPDERLTQEQALAAYTINPHIAVKTSNKRGHLKPGMQADMVVLDNDILNCEPQEILKTKVLATFCNGTRTF